MKISVVIPTYNRPGQLADVLNQLVASEAEDFEDVEIIVVDDGSEVPASEIVEKRETTLPFRVRYIYQDNAGPAEARNHGLQEATNEIVLFLDDDVLLFPDALRKHIEAHEAKPNSVIFGPYPYRIPKKETSGYRYLKGLIDRGMEGLANGDRFVPVETVASGNLSVRKSQFEFSKLYRSGLTIPVAEEYALISDLKDKQIPIYFVKDIRGWHLQPTTLKDVCKQNYKYGLGISEVALKLPKVLELDSLRLQFNHNTIIEGESLRSKIKKQVVKYSSASFIRSGMRFAAESFGVIGLPDKLLFPMYRIVIGLHSAAGILEGIRRFKRNNKEC